MREVVGKNNTVYIFNNTDQHVFLYKSNSMILTIRSKIQSIGRTRSTVDFKHIHFIGMRRNYNQNTDVVNCHQESLETTASPAIDVSIYNRIMTDVFMSINAKLECKVIRQNTIVKLYKFPTSAFSFRIS